MIELPSVNLGAAGIVRADECRAGPALPGRRASHRVSHRRAGSTRASGWRIAPDARVVLPDATPGCSASDQTEPFLSQNRRKLAGANCRGAAANVELPPLRRATQSIRVWPMRPEETA